MFTAIRTINRQFIIIRERERKLILPCNIIKLIFNFKYNHFLYLRTKNFQLQLFKIIRSRTFQKKKKKYNSPQSSDGKERQDFATRDKL